MFVCNLHQMLDHEANVLVAACDKRRLFGIARAPVSIARCRTLASAQRLRLLFAVQQRREEGRGACDGFAFVLHKIISVLHRHPLQTDESRKSSRHNSFLLRRSPRSWRVACAR